MNLSVLSTNRIIFGKNGVYDVVVEGDTIATASVACSDDATITGCNIVPYIEDQRVHPVRDNVIGASNIEDATVNLGHLVDAPPMSVANGGTGMSNIPFGKVLVGTETGTLGTSSTLSWNGSKLEVVGDLTIGNVRVGLRNDVFGRKSLFSFDSGGNRTNMVAPGLVAPSCEITDVAVGASDVTVTLAKTGGFPVEAYFAWSDTVTVFNRASVTTEGRPGVQNSGRVAFRGDTVHYTIDSGVSSSTYTLAATMRDARGTVSPVSYTSFTYP